MENASFFFSSPQHRDIICIQKHLKKTVSFCHNNAKINDSIELVWMRCNLYFGFVVYISLKNKRPLTVWSEKY